MALFEVNLGLGELVDSLKKNLTNTSAVCEKRYCYGCKQITEHVSVGWADAAEQSQKQNNRPEFNGLMKGMIQLGGMMNDINPLVTPILGRPFKCGRCGRVQGAGEK
jgi:hypothetical protein